jgi:alpha-D-xyloside xylohydrolase
MGLHPATQFLLGDALLVAPVTDASGAVDVIVPPGPWYEWYTGEAIDGPATLHRDIPLDRVALYARAGAIVPMLRETVDTLAVATDPEVDSYANDPGVLTVRVYPGEGARTFETLGGTTIAVDGRTVTLAGDHFTGYVFELHGLGGGEPARRIERGPGAQTFELP